MNYIFNDDRPIYIQLVEMLRIQIVSGKLKKGERIPSVRELALTARVNPNTMQKALAELEDEGLIYTERTNGKYVTEDGTEYAITKQNERLGDKKVIVYTTEEKEKIVKLAKLKGMSVSTLVVSELSKYFKDLI